MGSKSSRVIHPDTFKDYLVDFSISSQDMIVMYDCIIKPIELKTEVTPDMCNVYLSKIIASLGIKMGEVLEAEGCAVTSCEKDRVEIGNAVMMKILDRMEDSSGPGNPASCKLLKLRLNRACIKKRAALIARLSAQGWNDREFLSSQVLVFLSRDVPTYYQVILDQESDVYRLCETIVHKMTGVFNTKSMKEVDVKKDIYSWIMIYFCTVHYREKMEPKVFEISDLERRMPLADGVLLDSYTLLTPGSLLCRRTNVSGMLDHYGIYLGCLERLPLVVDMDTDDCSTAYVSIKTLNEFSGGYRVWVKLLKEKKTMIKNSRGVMCLVAQAILGKGHTYSILNANCESFASALYFGKIASSQSSLVSNIEKCKELKIKTKESGAFVTCSGPVVSEDQLNASRVYKINGLKYFGFLNQLGVLKAWDNVQVFSLKYQFLPIYYKSSLSSLKNKNESLDGTSEDSITVEMKYRHMLSI